MFYHFFLFSSFPAFSLPEYISLYYTQGFGSAFFFADPDPGKNLHADPDPGGIWGRGLGVKGKMKFFLSFYHVSDDS